MAAANPVYVAREDVPGDVLEKERGNASWPHAVMRDYIPMRRDFEPALGGKLNLFRFFIALPYAALALVLLVTPYRFLSKRLTWSAYSTQVLERKVLYWYCTMHPEERSDRPGKCPKCGMNFVPKYADDRGGK